MEHNSHWLTQSDSDCISISLPLCHGGTYVPPSYFRTVQSCILVCGGDVRLAHASPHFARAQTTTKTKPSCVLLRRELARGCCTILTSASVPERNLFFGWQNTQSATRCTSRFIDCLCRARRAETINITSGGWLGVCVYERGRL